MKDATALGPYQLVNAVKSYRRRTYTDMQTCRQHRDLMSVFLLFFEIRKSG
jgi:hypothetical protein